VLNYKKIPHTTHWLEYPEIKPLYQKLGIPPSGKNGPGQDAYTCPSIQFIPGDGSAPIFVTDSWKIAEFLEEKFPAPPIFPSGTIDKQKQVVEKMTNEILVPLLPALLTCSYHLLNEASKSYFRETRERDFNMNMDDTCTEASLKSALATAKEKYGQFLRGLPEFGPYIFGQQVVYADMILASILNWMKAVAEPELYSEVKDWDNGTWGKYLANFEEKGYTKVVD